MNLYIGVSTNSIPKNKENVFFPVGWLKSCQYLWARSRQCDKALLHCQQIVAEQSSLSDSIRIITSFLLSFHTEFSVMNIL